MDYKEEQVQELEILESIYPDEFEAINIVYPNIFFRINLQLDLVPKDSSSFTKDSVTICHFLVLDIKFPDNYPDVSPVIDISTKRIHKIQEEEDNNKELAYDDHGNPIDSKLENLPDKIDFSELVPILLDDISRQIEDDMLIGVQMCFTLISTIKESSELWFQNQLECLENKHENMLLEREMKDQEKFQGTKVTRESYIRWRKEFRKELKLDERDAERRLKTHQGRLSGKQIFERGLDSEDESEEQILAEDLKKL